MRTMKVAAIAATAAVAMGTTVARGSSSGVSHTKPVACLRQYKQWRNGPPGGGADYLQKELHMLGRAMLAADLPVSRAWLLRIGPTAQIMQTYPMPRCADPAGYWRDYLAASRAARA